jgi:hypothetical protein
MMDVGLEEMRLLRARHLGHIPTRSETYRAVVPFLARQFAYHWLHRLRILKY